MTTQANTIEKNEEIETIGIRLRTARDKKELTRPQLAEISGIAAKTIEKWEAGNHEPPLKRLRIIAEHLGVSVSYLLGMENDTSVPPGYETDTPVRDEPDDMNGENQSGMSDTDAVIIALSKIDEMRVAGFQIAPRKAVSLINHVQQMMAPLELQEIVTIGARRDLFPGECGSFLEVLDIFDTDFEAGQKFCGIVEERILDTAMFGIDLYQIEERPLIKLIEKLEIEHPNEWALPHMQDWEDHEFFVPHLRPLLRSSALTGDGELLTNKEIYPRRISEDIDAS